MYDRNWARSVVDKHREFCTRTEQINLCLQQLYEQSLNRNLPQNSIRDALTDSVQGKGKKSLWADYKKLCRKTPLDKDLLYKVFKACSNQIDVELKQRQFDFS